MKTRRAWSNILQMLKDNNLQPKISYPGKLSLKLDGERKIFHNKQKLKEFMSSKPALEKNTQRLTTKKKKTMNIRAREIIITINSTTKQRKKKLPQTEVKTQNIRN